jgi:Tol biopolymer transport system component
MRVRSRTVIHRRTALFRRKQLPQIERGERPVCFPESSMFHRRCLALSSFASVASGPASKWASSRRRFSAALGAVIAIFGSTSSAQQCGTELVSITSTGAQLPFPGPEGLATMSGDARFVFFTAALSTVVPGDTNGAVDVFRLDRQTGTVRRISIAPSGAEADSASFLDASTRDGRFALIDSSATNLVAGDTNNFPDLFVVDCQAGSVERVNVDSAGQQTQGGSTPHGSISRNGRRVAFFSDAPDLVAGDTNGKLDVFVRDLDTGVTSRASVDSNGVQGNGDSGILDELDPALSAPPQISDDGRYVLFTSFASNLVANDTNSGMNWNGADVFLRDTLTNVTERVSLANGGVQLTDDVCFGGVISADDRYVAFDVMSSGGGATLQAGYYIFDRVSGITNPVVIGPHIRSVHLTPDFQVAAYTTTVGFPQVWTFNLVTGFTQLVSVDLQGQAPATAGSGELDVSDDGSSVLFSSFADTLVPNDTNGAGDVFLRSCPSAWDTSFCSGTVANCPCGSGGQGLGGCENSHFTGGAELRGSGPASVTNDRFSLLVADTTPATSALFFQGDSRIAGGLGMMFGSGLRCVGGNIRRLGTRMSQNGTARYGYVGSDTPISVQGLIPVGGATRYYQVLYRDAASTCSGTFNLSNAISVQWTP